MSPSFKPLKPLSFLGADEQSIEMWGDSVVLTASVTVVVKTDGMVCVREGSERLKNRAA